MENEYDQIIRMILEGDKQAYGELYEKTIQNVFKTVHFLIEEKGDVDDLVQDIYIQVYKSLKKYDRTKPFQPWLIGIAMKQIHAYRRKRWMGLRILKKAEKHEQAEAVDFSDSIVNKITNEQLVALVNELPYKLKQVIILRYLNDYSQEEVAKILEIPVGTVKSRINSALTKLRIKGKNKQIFVKGSEECI